LFKTAPSIPVSPFAYTMLVLMRDDKMIDRGQGDIDATVVTRP
jgi:hypothetical protein